MWLFLALLSILPLLVALTFGAWSQRVLAAPLLGLVVIAILGAFPRPWWVRTTYLFAYLGVISWACWMGVNP